MPKKRSYSHRETSDRRLKDRYPQKPFIKRLLHRYQSTPFRQVEPL
jgi:hypothetical protein